MTLFVFIKQCLHKEAVRTEPDPAKVIREVLGAVKKEEKHLNRPP